MIADVILGYNIDTQNWIEDLKFNDSDCIVVLDYDYSGEPFYIDSILYISSLDIKKYLEKFDTINFYKSLYVYPGMSGKMSSLYKRD